MYNLTMKERKQLSERLKEYALKIRDEDAFSAQETAREDFNKHAGQIDPIPTRILGPTVDREVAYLTKSGHVLVTGSGEKYSGHSVREFHMALEYEQKMARKDEENFVDGVDPYSFRMARRTNLRTGRLVKALERIRSF